MAGHDRAGGRLTAAASRLAVVAFAVVVVACGAPGGSPSATSGSAGPFSLTIVNIDGPTLDVVINGSTVARVACQVDSSAPAPVLTAPTDGRLPWQVALKTQLGSTIGVWPEDGSLGPRMLLIRGKDIAELPAGTPAGPAPAPSCVPD